MTVYRTHQRPGRCTIASGDLKRQADQLYSTRSDPLQIKPLNDPDAGLEQGLVSFHPICMETADCVRPTRSPAREKLPSSAISTKLRNKSGSSPCGRGPFVRAGEGMLMAS